MQVEANCKDVRLRSLLEAASLMLRAVQDHQQALQPSSPSVVRFTPCLSESSVLTHANAVAVLDM